MDVSPAKRSYFTCANVWWKLLFHSTYRKLFPVILTDNGASFKDPAIFERPEGELLSRVFYCDPMASWQKGRLEKNHEFIRYIIPKGTTFAGLDQEQVTLITNHINSVARASLNGCTPFELALLLIDRKLLNYLPAGKDSRQPGDP
ncbi:MAG: hypothetical protein ACLTEB_13060 [Blautia obeum]